jgi:uncharacterized membrane protein YesL
MLRTHFDWRIYMARKKEFGEGPIFTITNYIFWFMAGSFYFAICNILLILTFLAMTVSDPQQATTGGADFSILTMLLISAIPAGPAITALLSAMGKLVREKDVNITRDYFRAYKENFKQSLFVWVLELAAIGILMIDLYFFSRQSYGTFIVPFIYAIGLIIIAMGLFAFPIISRFHMKTKDVIRLSFYYSIVKFKITFLNIAAIIIALFAASKFPITIIFVACAVCYLLMYYQKDLFKELENQFKDANGSKEVKEDNSDKVFSDKLNDSLK